MPASPRRVWERVTTAEGINDELRPLMRMTTPRGIAEIEPGHRFLEVSTMLSMQSWQHERTVVAAPPDEWLRHR